RAVWLPCSSTARTTPPTATIGPRGPSRRSGSAPETTPRRSPRATRPTTSCSTATSPGGPAGPASRSSRSSTSVPCRARVSSWRADSDPRRSRRRSGVFDPSALTWPRASRSVREGRIMRRSRSSSAAPRLPDERGHFGQYGGRYVAETLMPQLLELERAYARLARDAAFQRELTRWLREYAGRPTRLYFARRLSGRLGGARIFLKREDLLHTGAHKINNTIGQVLVARRLRKSRLIAETGAGQHGVA